MADGSSSAVSLSARPGQPSPPRGTALGRMLRLRENLAYGVGDFASGLYWQSYTLYLAFFYTDVFGLSALAAATLLASSRSLDALFDPVIGALADRTQTRWGKFRPYLLWLSVPLALAAVCTFTVPHATPEARLWWAGLTFNVSMLLFAGINIPYAALLGVLSPNAAERTTLASAKFVFAFAAGLFVSAALLPLCQALGAGDPARGWQRCFMLFGVLATAGFLTTFLGTRERVSASRRQQTNLRRDLRDLGGNGPWWILVAISLLAAASLAVRNSVAVHYFKYYTGTQALSLPEFLPRIGGTHSWSMEALVGAFNGAGAVASLVGVVLAPLLTGRFGRKRCFFVLWLIAMLSTAAVYWLKPEQITGLFALGLIGALAGGPLSPLLWAMYADAADYGEWKTGRRATGLIFSGVIFASKQGWALGAFVALGLLSQVGFVANAAQSSESLAGLRLLMSLGPAAIGGLGLLCLLAYPLDELRMSRIAADLTRRRAEEASADAPAGM